MPSGKSGGMSSSAYRQCFIDAIFYDIRMFCDEVEEEVDCTSLQAVEDANSYEDSVTRLSWGDLGSPVGEDAGFRGVYVDAPDSDKSPDAGTLLIGVGDEDKVGEGCVNLVAPVGEEDRSGSSHGNIVEGALMSEAVVDEVPYARMLVRDVIEAFVMYSNYAR